MSKDLKVGQGYDTLNKHIQINFDTEGYHTMPIERYYLMEKVKHNILTDKIQIVRVDIPFFVKKCYNEDARKLDHKDRIIGFMGIDDIDLANKIKRNDDIMEDLYKKVEEFSDDNEILGAYDGEWHKKEVERVVLLDKMEQAMEKGLEQGIEQGIEQRNISIAKNMISENLDIELISKITGLTLDQIKKL